MDDSMPRRVKVGMILQQPWAKLVADGVSPVLVRKMTTKARGRVAILATGVDLNALVTGTVLMTGSFANRPWSDIST